MVKKFLRYSLGGVFALMLFLLSGGHAFAAVPQVTGVGLISTDQMVINFSEPMVTSSVVFTTTPTFTFTPLWSNNNTTVSLLHSIFSTNQAYTVNVTAGTDLSTGLNSISNLPYVVNVVNGVAQTTVLTPSNISVTLSDGSTTTNSNNVTLAISATNASSMIISNNPFFTDASWETYATTKNWILPQGNGTKTIYAKFISSSSIESSPVSVNITLDSSYVPVSVIPVVPTVPVTPTPVTEIPAVPATPATPATHIEGCKPGSGDLFDTTSGKSCTISATPATPATPASKTYNFGTITLKNGSKGESVKELQRFLNQVLNLGLAIDGKLGPKTITVIKKWQRDNGLVSDGLIGAKTKLKMNESVQ